MKSRVLVVGKKKKGKGERAKGKGLKRRGERMKAANDAA
jgi:hypothetical protein